MMRIQCLTATETDAEHCAARHDQGSHLVLSSAAGPVKVGMPQSSQNHRTHLLEEALPSRFGRRRCCRRRLVRRRRAVVPAAPPRCCRKLPGSARCHAVLRRVLFHQRRALGAGGLPAGAEGARRQSHRSAAHCHVLLQGGPLPDAPAVAVRLRGRAAAWPLCRADAPGAVSALGFLLITSLLRRRLGSPLDSSQLGL